jgi:hypothetical protein
LSSILQVAWMGILLEKMVNWLPGATEENSQIEGDCGYSDFYKTVDTVIMEKVTYDQILTFTLLVQRVQVVNSLISIKNATYSL